MHIRTSFFTALSLIAVVLISPLAVAQETVVGVVERIRGGAVANSVAGIRPLTQGDQILLGEAIQSGVNARVLIRFSDDSTLTLGENALVIIDEFVFAGANDAQSQVIDIVRGVFGYISGQVSRMNAEAVAIRTPVGTIGIRGTEFAGGELFVGMPPGRPHYGFQVQVGAIEVSTPGGAVILDEPGEGTFLPMTQVAAPTPPRIWSEAAAAELEDALAF